MNVEYCQLCKTKVTERDFQLQHAFWLDNRPFCKACAVGQGGNAPAPKPSGIRAKVQADFAESLETNVQKKGSSGLIKSPGSGLNKKPGSGLTKSPGSGIQRAVPKTSSSGIMKATLPTTSPGSGIMKSHGTSLGSGLNKPTGSGIGKAAGSGIRTASTAGKARTSGLNPSVTPKPMRKSAILPTVPEAPPRKTPPAGNRARASGIAVGSASGAPRPEARRRLTMLRNKQGTGFSWLPILGCLIAIGIVVELFLLLRR